MTDALFFKNLLGDMVSFIGVSDNVGPVGCNSKQCIKEEFHNA